MHAREFLKRQICRIFCEETDGQQMLSNPRSKFPSSTISLNVNQSDHHPICHRSCAPNRSMTCSDGETSRYRGCRVGVRVEVWGGSLRLSRCCLSLVTTCRCCLSRVTSRVSVTSAHSSRRHQRAATTRRRVASRRPSCSSRIRRVRMHQSPWQLPDGVGVVRKDAAWGRRRSAAC